VQGGQSGGADDGCRWWNGQQFVTHTRAPHPRAPTHCNEPPPHPHTGPNQSVKNVLRQCYGDKDAVTDELVDCILKPGLQPGAVDVFLDFISYSGGPLPEELIEQVGAGACRGRGREVCVGGGGVLGVAVGFESDQCFPTSPLITHKSKTPTPELQPQPQPHEPKPQGPSASVHPVGHRRPLGGLQAREAAVQHPPVRSRVRRAARLRPLPARRGPRSGQPQDCRIRGALRAAARGRGPGAEWGGGGGTRGGLRGLAL